MHPLSNTCFPVIKTDNSCSSCFLTHDSQEQLPYALPDVYSNNFMENPNWRFYEEPSYKITQIPITVLTFGLTATGYYARNLSFNGYSMTQIAPLCVST